MYHHRTAPMGSERRDLAITNGEAPVGTRLPFMYQERSVSHLSARSLDTTIVASISEPLNKSQKSSSKSFQSAPKPVTNYEKF